jgi:hypothetical protein
LRENVSRAALETNCSGWFRTDKLFVRARRHHSPVPNNSQAVACGTHAAWFDFRALALRTT